jgi:putative peptide zinc metalloprotease protein
LATGSGDISAVYEVRYNPNYTPRSSSRAHIESLTVDGKPSFILTKESAGEYYEVDPITYAIWRLLDGRRTVKEIFEEVKSMAEKLTEKDVKDVVVSLAEEGVLESTELEARRGRVEVMSAFQLNVQLVKNTSESFIRFFRLTRKLIRRWELPASLAITAVGFALFYASFVHIFENPSSLNVAGSALLGFFFYQLVVLLPVYAVHELAHAAMCDYYGGKPGEIGTGLYYLAPFFYCDTSDAWRLSRRARIMISVAGPLSTTVISAFFVFWSYFTSGYFRDVLEIAAFFGFFGSLTNFSPVIETDGYYILADILNIPNLRDEAFSFMKRGVLAIFRRPVKAVRQSSRERRIIAAYTVITVAWLAFFGYTTAWLMGIYVVSAYLALSSLVLTLLGLDAFNLTTVGVNVATLAYFGMIVAGFAVMGAVSYKNIRMRGMKLETIHGKRVSAFLPLPSDVKRPQSSGLVDAARKLAKKYAHFSTVTLQPPFCVVELKLGRVDQSLEGMWEEMRRIEDAFKSLHREFLGRVLARRGSTSTAEKIRESLVGLAGEFPPGERGRAASSVTQFVRMQDDRVRYILQAAFGTVWTLGLSPDDYGRIRKGIFPGLIAEDLSVTDLPSEVEDFKVRRVLGLDAMAKLSTEIEAESREVYSKPEVYQTTVFLEPVKSRLVFVGRTDKVEGSVVWLGGLYLYQAWMGYIREALEEATLGLKSIRLSHPASFTPAQARRLRESELETLRRDLERLATLGATVNEAIQKTESTFESANNFHEMLGSLVTDQDFDVGLYRPILAANEEHLKGLKDKIEEFREESGWLAKRVAASRKAIEEEHARRASESAHGGSLTASLYHSINSLMTGEARKGRTQAFDTEVKLMFAATRLAYGVVIGGDVIL